MIFQCEASELEKAIAQIKNWKAGIDTVPKNLKKVNSYRLADRPPVTVHLSLLGIDEGMQIFVHYPACGEFFIKLKGLVLDSFRDSSEMTLDGFYYLCEKHRLTLTGKIQIVTDPYQIDLYQVEE